MVATVIFVGADKGGVGKSFLSRVAMSFLPEGTRAVDMEARQTLSRYYPDALRLDPDKTDDQMKLFDQLPAVTLIDLPARTTTRTLKSLQRLGLLDDAKAKRIDIRLLQVLGPTTESIDEVTDAAAQLDDATHYTIKNMVSPNSQFFDFDEKLFRALNVRSLGTFPHLDDRTKEAVDARAQTFRAFVADTDNRNSFTLKREVTAFLRDAEPILAPVLKLA